MKIAGMSMVVVLSLFLGVGTASAAWTFKVPDTGQTECFEETGGVWDTADCAGTSGQDGNDPINLPSFKSYDASGNEVPNQDSSAVVVKDEWTGLYWELKTNDANPTHGVGVTKAWVFANNTVAGFDADPSYSWLSGPEWEPDWTWRLPTREELRTIVNYQYGDGSSVAAFEAIAGSGPDYPLIASPDGGYWTCDIVDRQDPFFYWIVYTRVNKDDDVISSATSMPFRGVYGPPLEEDPPSVAVGEAARSRSFQSTSGSDIVYDTVRTGLSWQKDGTNQRNWDGAIQYCNGLDLDGLGSTWRLPTIKELETIFKEDHEDATETPIPRIDESHFTAVQGMYWSSTTAQKLPEQAWVIDFDGGKARKQDKTLTHYVRCVSGGVVQTFTKCDFDNSGTATIEDAIIALKICAGIEVTLDLAGELSDHCLGGDPKIGIEEAICALQWAAEIRK